MKWVIRFVVALFFGFVFFGAIQHYFEPNRWISIVVSVFAAVMTAALATMDFGKKWHDFRKGPYELRKLQREEEAAEREKNSRIQAPTPEEVRRHGQSHAERTLEERFRSAGRDPMNPHPFVVDSDEKKL